MEHVLPPTAERSEPVRRATRTRATRQLLGRPSSGFDLRPWRLFGEVRPVQAVSKTQVKSKGNRGNRPAGPLNVSPGGGASCTGAARRPDGRKSSGSEEL